MNVVYCRVAQQSSESIDYQKYQCKKFLESKGISIDEIYIDNGFSANKADRLQLINMINNLDNIKSITVLSVDRLYRDSLKLLDFYKLLKSKNIALYDVLLDINVIKTYQNGLLEMLCTLAKESDNAKKYINQQEDKIICPWCDKEVTEQQINDEETFVNGGEQTGGELELWHKECANKCEELERENGMRI
jgi:hypothetical protein